MPKKSKSKGKKRRASTGININIKNVLKQNIGDRTRQMPDFIRPLGQRPIESQAYDNRYRLQNPSVTYMSTPLANRPSLRDIVNAPALPQVSGQPRALRPDIQPVEVNPNDIARSRPSQVAIRGEPVPTPAEVGEAAIRRYRDAELALRREELRLAKREELMKPIVGQRLEPAQADASQLLVALQVDQKAREIARERGRLAAYSKPLELFNLPPPHSAEELLGAEPQHGSRSMIPRASSVFRQTLEGVVPQVKPSRRGVAGAGDA